MIDVTPVIRRGSIGARQWPLARTGSPKQFLCPTCNESVFELAAKRLRRLASVNIQVAPPRIVTDEEHRFLATEQAREAGVPLGAALLPEPFDENAAPAPTLAAFAASKDGTDSVLALIQADQTVANDAAFTQALQAAIVEAVSCNLVILGTMPIQPETGYGYIQVHPAQADTAALQGERLVEKPGQATTTAYRAEGGYYWNAGMFVLKASVWLQVLRAFHADISIATRSAEWAKHTAATPFVGSRKAEFAAAHAESVHYSVTEHRPGSPFCTVMVPLDAGWSDLGAWMLCGTCCQKKNITMPTWAMCCPPKVVTLWCTPPAAWSA